MLDFAAELDAARTLDHVAKIAAALWAAHAAGALGDAEAEKISLLVRAAQARITPKGLRAPAGPIARVTMFPPHRRRRVSPDRAERITRRRRLALSGPMPPALAARFTTGQLAALRIVADEVRARGACTLSLEEIAVRAGVCVTLARGAIRLAAGDGLLVMTERPRHGARSLTNIIRVISQEWRVWIARGRAIGSKNVNPSDTKFFNYDRRGGGEGKRLTKGEKPRAAETLGSVEPERRPAL